MLPRPFRIVKEKDFANVMKLGRGWRRPEGQLKVMPNQLPHNRYGIIVANKVAKKAHDRNLLKRRLREIVRGSSPSLKTGFDIVFVAYAPVLKMDYAELEKLIHDAFKQQYLIKND